MKIKWTYWVLIVSILLVIWLIFYGLIWGFSGQGSKILDGNIEEYSAIGKSVSVIDYIKGDRNAQRERDLGELIAAES
jgi:hypothetical protein